MGGIVTDNARRAFLAERRAASVLRFDTLHSPRDRVHGWLEAAGLAITAQADADHYWHLLLTRTTDR